MRRSRCAGRIPRSGHRLATEQVELAWDLALSDRIGQWAAAITEHSRQLQRPSEEAADDAEPPPADEAERHRRAVRAAGAVQDESETLLP